MCYRIINEESLLLIMIIVVIYVYVYEFIYDIVYVDVFVFKWSYFVWCVFVKWYLKIYNMIVFLE